MLTIVCTIIRIIILIRGKKKSRERKEDNNKIKRIYEITAALSRLLNSHVINTLQFVRT